MLIGGPITGANVPAGATVVSVTANSITISKPIVTDIPDSTTITFGNSRNLTTNADSPATGETIFVNVPNPALVQIGGGIWGADIPAGATITAVSSNSITINTPIVTDIQPGTVLTYTSIWLNTNLLITDNATNSYTGTVTPFVANGTVTFSPSNGTMTLPNQDQVSGSASLTLTAPPVSSGEYDNAPGTAQFLLQGTQTYSGTTTITGIVKNASMANITGGVPLYSGTSAILFGSVPNTSGITVDQSSALTTFGTSNNNATNGAVILAKGGGSIFNDVSSGFNAQTTLQLGGAANTDGGGTFAGGAMQSFLSLVVSPGSDTIANLGGANFTNDGSSNYVRSAGGVLNLVKTDSIETVATSPSGQPIIKRPLDPRSEQRPHRRDHHWNQRAGRRHRPLGEREPDHDQREHRHHDSHQHDHHVPDHHQRHLVQHRPPLSPAASSAGFSSARPSAATISSPPPPDRWRRRPIRPRPPRSPAGSAARTSPT